MSGDFHNELDAIKKTLAKHDERMDQHSIILTGDNTKYPPIEGVTQVLQQISKTITDPKQGNAALYDSCEAIKNEDKRRLAWFNGAKWLTVLFWTIFGTLGGMVIMYFTMLKTH